MSGENVRAITLNDHGDVTIWAHEASVESPVIYPYWPVDKQLVPVGVKLLPGDEWDVQVPLTREAVMDLRDPSRLWFFVPREQLVRDTNADEGWWQDAE